MLESLIKAMTPGPHALETIVSELVKILFTVLFTTLVLERWLAYKENRKWRAARQLFVSSLGSRLDSLALDWGAVVLNSLSFISEGLGVEKLDILIRSVGTPASPTPPIKLSPETQRLEKIATLKLDHIGGRLEDVLNTIDAAGFIITRSMHHAMATLRETVLTDLRGIRDLRDLLEDPSPEQASNLMTGAMTALLSCKKYMDLLEQMWFAIPAKGKSAAPQYDYLPTVRSAPDQGRVIANYLGSRFPEYRPKMPG